MRTCMGYNDCQPLHGEEKFSVCNVHVSASFLVVNLFSKFIEQMCSPSKPCIRSHQGMGERISVSNNYHSNPVIFCLVSCSP